MSLRGFFDPLVISILSANSIGRGEADHSIEDGLVTRTLTEYVNNRITSVGDYAFYGNKAIKKVVLRNATIIGASAFIDCAALEVVDLTKVSDFADTRTFNYCSNLKTMILRSETRVPLSQDHIYGTPLNDMAGYLYVPAALVSDYMQTFEWVVAEVRALEDYTVDGTITGELDMSKM